jgi:hypothetical protein
MSDNDESPIGDALDNTEDTDVDTIPLLPRQPEDLEMGERVHSRDFQQPQGLIIQIGSNILDLARNMYILYLLR